MENADWSSRFEGSYSIRYAKFRLALLLAAGIPLAALLAGVAMAFSFVAADVWADLLSGPSRLKAAKTLAGAILFIGIVALVILGALQLTLDFIRNAPAAVLTREFIEGTGFLRKKRFLWKEIGALYTEEGRVITIARKPKTSLQRWISMLSLGALEDRIFIHPFMIEDTADQIHSAISYYSGRNYW